MSPALRGSLWMLCTMFSFVAMAVAGRELSGFSPFEVVAMRCLVTLAILIPIAARSSFAAVRTERLGFHAARNAVHFVGQVSWFHALGALAIAEVTAIEYTMTPWAIVFAALFLGERVDAKRWLTVALGFAGIVVMLRPGIEVVSAAAIIMLVGSAFYGGSSVMVKSLTRTDSAFSVVFYMAVCQLVLAAVPTAFDFTMPSWDDAPWIVLVGVTGLTAHYTYTRALAVAEVSVVSPIDFLRLPVTALVGWLAYTETLDLWVWLGAALVIGANWYNVWRAARR
jgi:drug/metabolite transporter (DMT)-like permease